MKYIVRTGNITELNTLNGMTCVILRPRNLAFGHQLWDLDMVGK